MSCAYGLLKCDLCNQMPELTQNVTRFDFCNKVAAHGGVNPLIHQNQEHIILRHKNSCKTAIKVACHLQLMCRIKDKNWRNVKSCECTN